MEKYKKNDVVIISNAIYAVVNEVIEKEDQTLVSVSLDNDGTTMEVPISTVSKFRF